MKLRTLLPAAAGMLLVIGSCEQPDGGTDKLRTVVSGTVVRSDDASGVPGAIVRDLQQAAKRDTTDATGNFTIEYDLDEGQTYSTSLVASMTGFGNDTSAISLEAGTDISVTLTVTADSTSPQSGSTSGQPASIVLLGTDVNTISIRGSGVNESALLTYEVRDSLGNPILGSNVYSVRFSIIGGPGGSEYVYPTSAQINATTGRVTTRLNSGTKPGVIQVQASTRNDSVLSAPARITIASGPPDSANVSISREKANIPGYVFDNERARISVILGDRYQNPVPPGTAVYFTTTGGLVQATGTTDDDGIASVDLISANPRPPGGVATITARTIGDTAVRKADSLIQRTINVVFSGTTRIIMQSTPILIADSGSFLLAYEVQDQFGNPIEGGSTVAVTVDGPAGGELVLSGDVEFDVIDSDDPAETDRSVLIADNTRGGLEGYFTVVVSVKSRNGDATASVAGYLQSTGGGGSSTGPSVPRSIAVNTITNRQLSVKGTGGNETSRLTFVVRDSLGNPVGNPLDPTQKAYVTFSINPPGGLGGGEFVFPAGDSTNNSGIVGVTFNAGTRAGVVQVVASTFVPGVGNITASPVQLTIQGGLPDSNRFVVALSQENMPGLAKSGQLGVVEVQAADEFGNPAQTGTAVYFSTDLGLIQATGFLTDEGVVSANLNGGVVGASSGNGTITVQTVGKSGESIVRTVPFLFTGRSLISGLPANGFLISDSGSYSFNYVVSDLNGNPLSPGTQIAATVEGPGSGDLELSGDIEFTLPDTRTGFTNFNVRAFDKSKGGVSGPVSFRLSVTSDNGDVSITHTGSVLGAGQSPATGGGSTFAQSIEKVSISPSDPIVLSVAGTGVNEAAVIQFIVKDSLGRSVDEAHAALVTFTVTGGPGGSEFVFPTSATTDASGLVSTTFNAGTKAGVLQVRAQTLVSGRTVYSAPIPITIVGGLPDSAHFTVWSDQENYAGWVDNGSAIGNVSVQLGDQYGNPAQPNTAVYFTTNGGIITGSDFTDDFGKADATLFGGQPNPPGGIDTISVSTVDRNGNRQTRYIIKTFSGPPIVTPLSTANDSITVFDGGFFDLSFRLADANGNPLAPGNSVSAVVLGTAAGGVNLSGDNNFTTIDTRLTSLTQYTIRVSDAVPNGGVSGSFAIRIDVTGPNYPSGTYRKFVYGTLGAPQAITPPSPTVKNPAQIAFIGISATDIFVQGVGALENTVITYEVRDSLGSAIEANPRAYATFNLTFFPNSFVPGGTTPRLIPSADSTDNAGRLRVSVSSGTTAGIIQVTSTVMVGGVPITSSPVKVTVHAGFPDQRHFTIAPEMYNFPGIGWKSFVEQDITVQVADKYSNPVQAGTAVYFHSQHGTMQTGEAPGLTDSRGFVTRILNSANPYPLGSDSIALGQGWSKMYAQTLGEAGTLITDSLTLLWTGNPIITLTSGPNPFTVANGASDGPFTFTVQDFLGHPMSGGTGITVAAGDARVDGDADITLFDTQSSGVGITSFTILLTDGDAADTDPPQPTLLTVTVNHPVLGVFKAVIATGTVD